MSVKKINGAMKIWHICTVEYYSAIKSENMMFAGRLMELAKKKLY